MRKIERDMNRAIRTGRNFSSSNTAVRHGFDNEADVYLHGNHIATVKDHSIIIKDGGWQSNTTKSRLNAILEEFASGCRVIQRDFEWFVSDFGTLKPFVDVMKV